MPKSLTFLQYVTTAFDNIKDAVLLIGIEQDETYRLVLANKAFHDLSGFHTNCIGEKISEFVNAETYGFLHKQYQKIIEFKQPLEFTRWFTTPAGRKAYEVEMIPVLHADQVVQILGIARDVTELTKLKEEVQTLRAAQYRGGQFRE
jgi:PAS domain S-box-containing protein